MRVQRNFAFADLSGFSALTEIEGDERAVAVLGSFRVLVREMCSRRGVRIAKWLGDGAMLVGVEGPPLLAGMLEVQHSVIQTQLPTAVRCGMASGEVILLEGDDYIGHPVNVASRLCEIAPGGVVLVTEEVLDYLPKWGIVQRIEERTIRGLERTIPVAEVGFRPLEGPTAPDPVCGILLTKEVAEETVFDFWGQEIYFCSESCKDTWDSRPKPVVEGPGSLRTPLIGT